MTQFDAALSVLPRVDIELQNVYRIFLADVC
jgi:hypothetical protein